MPSEDIQGFLLRSGGRTDAGLPRFRLVQTDKVLEKVGALWTDWPEYVPSDDRGKLITGPDGRPTVSDKPLRQVAEVREVPKYPHLDPGEWILERAFPTLMPEASWYAEVVPGTSVPKLGPYPHNGYYQMIGGPFPLIPSQQFIADTIAFWEKQRRDMPADTEQYVRQRTQEWQDRHDYEQAKRKAELAAKIADSISYLESNTLTAGALRTKVAERAGLREHVGN